jgi:hypothetical protein
MEKVNVRERSSMFSVRLGVLAVMISGASALGQMVPEQAGFNDTITKLGEIIIYAIAGAIYLFHQIRNWINNRKIQQKEASLKAKSGIEFVTLIDLKVKHAENNMFKDYNFLRSFVILFHNGEFADNGLSLTKMTVKHEVTGSKTVKKLTDNYQNKPIPEMFHSAIRRVVFEGHYFLEDREIVKDNVSLYQWMEIYDVGSMLFVEIRDSNTGKIVAMLVMQWRIKDGIHKEQIPQVKEDKKAIEDIYDTL